MNNYDHAVTAIAAVIKTAVDEETLRCAEKARQIYTNTDGTADRVSGAILNGIVGCRICTQYSGIPTIEEVKKAIALRGR